MATDKIKITLDITVANNRDEVKELGNYKENDLVYVIEDDLLNVIMKEEDTKKLYLLALRKDDAFSFTYCGITQIVDRINISIKQLIAREK